MVEYVPRYYHEDEELYGEDDVVDAVPAYHVGSGSGWYVGAMTDWTERDMTIDLSFLGEGDFVMEIFTDGVNADKAASDWRKEVRPVPASRKITVHLAPGGGFAAKIAPASH